MPPHLHPHPRRFHQLRLSLRLLRFRVAAMVWTFMLLGAAWPDGLPAFSVDLLWAALALAASYVAATSVNDIADADVDRINHPGDRARPLVTGDACARDLWRLHLLGCATALGAAAPLGWTAVGVVVRDGASVGARAVCVAPVALGRWSMVAAGAVVVADVPDHALVAGVPARQIGWVGPAGARLVADGDALVCPLTGARWRLENDTLLEER